MGRTFTRQRGKTRVVFGAGSWSALGGELDALGARRCAILGTPGRAEDVSRLESALGARVVRTFTEAREHVPVETVKAAREAIEGGDVDTLIAVGGGSAIGLAKALALDVPVQLAFLPTTYSGSEMTPIFGTTEGGEKRTGRDERARAALVVYDPEASLSLPLDLTIASLWNALAHALEAMWLSEDDAATRAVGEAAVSALVPSMGALMAAPGDLAARMLALEGAHLAALAFADTGSGLHHKLCHVLGGMFALPHAKTHAVVLPHVARFLGAAAPNATSALARALRVVDPARGLEDLGRVTGIPSGLGALGVKREDVPRVVEAMMKSPDLRPRALERDAFTAMLTTAIDGRPRRTSRTPLRAPEILRTMTGFGGNHASEALPGALPQPGNAPRIAPYGLIPELVNGTPFTVKNAENSRVWMYRVRASFSHTPFSPLPRGAFTAALEGVTPARTRWKPMPIPEAPHEVDLLDGMVTLGGAHDALGHIGYLVHMYAANADMHDRSFSNADGDLLLVPQEGTLECRTELGWLRAAPGTVIVIPRGIKFAVGLAEGRGRGWMLEIMGPRLRLPERGLIGSNGLADARHFHAPEASYEDRLCPEGFELVHKLGGRLFSAEQQHSPFDVVAWHGVHAPYSYDLSLFSPMGAVKFDHQDPSILTVLTAPLDDMGRAVCDFVIFPGRWDVLEKSFRPPFMHRNAASEVNGVLKTPSPSHGYDPGCTFLSPLLTAHGVSTKTYEAVFSMSEEKAEGPVRLPDESLWIMFESALPFELSSWARQTSLVDDGFHELFEGMRSWFTPDTR